MVRKIYVICLFSLFVLLYLIPLQERALFIHDETRYAEVPREMIASGDWVVPRIDGLRYFEKPVMGYWLTAISIQLFGENNFAVRFPSALATGLTALLIFFTCLRCFPANRQISWLAVLVYLTSLGVATIGTFAVLDPPLTLFLSVTLVSFFFATQEQHGSKRERLLLCVAGIFTGCAFLTKGFLAIAILLLTCGPYLIVQKRCWRESLLILCFPVIGTILISLPWSILIHLREPKFWHFFFWNEHIRRFCLDSAQHCQPFWFFAAVLPAMFMPWIMLLPASVFGALQRASPRGVEKRTLSFCLCWFLFPFFFFSASSGKLITYILPCFPPLSILFAYGLSWWLKEENTEKKHLQRGIGCLLFITYFSLFIFILVHLFGSPDLRLFHQSSKWLLLAGGIAAMALVLVIALRAKKNQSKIVFFALSFTFLLFTVHYTIPTRVLSKKAPDSLIMRHINTIKSDAIILTGEDLARAACWYLKRNDIYLVERAGELQYGLNYDDSRYRYFSPTMAGDFIRKHRGNVVLIASQDEYKRWHSFFPLPVSVDSSGKDGCVLIQY